MAPTPDRTPRKVVLFSGHMIDAPGRKTLRFPADKEPIAAHAIGSTLDNIGLAASDLCICGGACGGDLIFAEAALSHNAKTELYIPFDEKTFLEKSVEFAGDKWRKRFFAVKLRGVLHVMPLEREIDPEANPYEQNNLWMLEAAERFGPERVDFICLWDGKEGDGPGGTGHLMKEVANRGGQTYWLDTTKLWN
ncbi:hypothetical protein IYW40_12070 [Methylocystis sp. H4A]|nr:hypothetical protein [Methylocystis sp. H4A]